MSDFEDLFRQEIPLGEAASYFIGIKKFASAEEEAAAKAKAVQSLQGGSRSALHSLARKDLMDKYQKGERTGDVAGRVLGGAAGLTAGALTGGKSKAIAGVLGAGVGQHVGGAAGKYFGRNADVKKFRAGFKKKAEQLLTTEDTAPGKGVGATAGIVDDTEIFSIDELNNRAPKLVLKKSVPMVEKRAMFKRALDDLGIGEQQKSDAELTIEPPSAVPEQALDAPPAPPVVLSPETDAYLKAEMMGQLEERTQESEYYKQVATQAGQEAQAAQQAAQAANEQATQAQQAADAANQQIQQAMETAQQVGESAVASASTAHAIAAQAQKRQLDTLNESAMHRQLSANLRSGVINMKQRIMEAVQQDETAAAEPMIGAPPTNSAPPMSPPMGMPPGAPPGMPPEPPMGPPPEGPPPGAPPGPPGAPPGGPPPGAPPGPPPEAPPGPPGAMKMAGMAEFRQMVASAKPMLIQEAKKRAPYALGGAIAGGGAMLAGAGRHAEADRADVARLESLKAQGGTGFGTSMQLAKARMRLAINEVADEHPYASAAMGAGLGASTAAMAGPTFVESLKRGRGLLKG